MLIRLTLVQTKDPFYMRAKDVRTIQKDAKDRITTMVTTDIFMQTGPICYAVVESVDEVARMVHEALGVYSERAPVPVSRLIS